MGSEQAIEGELIPASRRGANLSGSRRRFRLTDARGVRRELAGLYSELRNNEVDTDTARAAAFVLRCLLESLRLDEVEKRLTALEGRK
jgi:hypothetical protein